jgi:hypothetical protein
MPPVATGGCFKSNVHRLATMLSNAPGGNRGMLQIQHTAHKMRRRTIEQFRRGTAATATYASPQFRISVMS